MTELRSKRTKTILETSDEVRDGGAYRPVIIEAHPLHMTVRLKGLRQSYNISYAAVWSMAVKAEVERVRREKKAAKR